MFKHARNNMLTKTADYNMSQEDIKAYQHNWTQSIRLVSKTAREQRWSVLKNF